MRPLEQAGSPDQEPMDPHGAGRGSRSKDDASLELGAVNQELIGLLRIQPLDLDGAHINSQLAPRANEIP